MKQQWEQDLSTSSANVPADIRRSKPRWRRRGHRNAGHRRRIERAVEFAAETPKDGAVVIAAITSCTNTSNPSVMLAAGLLARKARAKGLNRQPWVKTSLAPGSRVVTEYLEKSGLNEDLDALGFQTVGYGCTTCIGNSGPLEPEISKAINERTTWSRPRCCRATATSKAASAPR